MPGNFLFANNAASNLAGPITNVGTTATLTPGSGVLFPLPTGGNFFCLTFNDAATGLLNEITHVTSRSGDTVTLVRAQEGTIGLNWNAGDFASNLLTAGSLANFMQSPQGIIYSGTDTGSANNYFLSSMSQTVASYFVDMALVFIPLQSNTGPSTVNCLGIGSVPIVRAHSGVAVLPNDIQAGVPAFMIYDGARFTLYSTDFPPPQLKANSTLYVNTATGNDSTYDGTTATVSGTTHGPFKTIQRAVTETFKYGPSIYTMTINVAAGTYPEAVATPGVVGPSIIINGAGIGVTTVTGSNNNHTFEVISANQMIVTNLTTTTGTGAGPPCCFVATSGGSMNVHDCAAGNCTGYVFEAYAGYMFVGNFTFLTGCSALQFVSAVFGGFMSFYQNCTWTFNGPYTVSYGIVASSNGSVALPLPGAPIFVNPSNVTGGKYFADLNGIINTQGQSTSFFPGSGAGVTQRGGWYA